MLKYVSLGKFAMFEKLSNMSKLPILSRKVIEAATVGYYRTAGGTRPDLRVVDLKDKRIVVKDFIRSDPLFRLIVGPILIRREYGALRKLIGVEGIPQLVGKVDRYALAIENVDGISLAELDSQTQNAFKKKKKTSDLSSQLPALQSKAKILDEDFYVQLRETIDQMHSRGVAHCDLRSRGNVMLGNNGRPYLVDFAACVFRGRGINPFFKWLFHQFVLADRNAILRIKQRHSPELLTEDEKAELARPMPFERPAKFIGENVRMLTRRLLTRQK